MKSTETQNILRKTDKSICVSLIDQKHLLHKDDAIDKFKREPL